MKNRIPFQLMMASVVAVSCAHFAPGLVAQNATPPLANPAVAADPSSAPPPVQLSYGVPEILKLGRAHVSDEVIVAFIKSSGRIYRLSASEILYLREQGVSDPVLTAMLESRRNVTAPAPQLAPEPAQNAAPANSGSSSPHSASVVTQPAPTYVAPAPVYVQPSPVYIYPSSSYEYYRPYNNWSYWGYPALSFGVGFGLGYYGGYHGGGHGYYHGGYHGGGHYDSHHH